MEFSTELAIFGCFSDGSGCFLTIEFLIVFLTNSVGHFFAKYFWRISIRNSIEINMQFHHIRIQSSFELYMFLTIDIIISLLLFSAFYILILIVAELIIGFLVSGGLEINHRPPTENDDIGRWCNAASKERDWLVGILG